MNDIDDYWNARVAHLEAEIERLRQELKDAVDERDVYRDRALPEAAGIMNTLSEVVTELQTELDQITAVMDDANIDNAEKPLHDRLLQWIAQVGSTAIAVRTERDELRMVLTRLRFLFGPVSNESLVNLITRAVGDAERLRGVIEAVQMAEARLDTGDDEDEEDALRSHYADTIEQILRCALDAADPTPDERERVLEDHPELRSSLQRGMEDLAAGRVRDLGSFAAHLEDDET